MKLIFVLLLGLMVLGKLSVSHAVMPTLIAQRWFSPRRGDVMEGGEPHELAGAPRLKEEGGTGA